MVCEEPYFVEFSVIVVPLIEASTPVASFTALTASTIFWADVFTPKLNTSAPLAPESSNEAAEAKPPLASAPKPNVEKAGTESLASM